MFKAKQKSAVNPTTVLFDGFLFSLMKQSSPDSCPIKVSWNNAYWMYVVRNETKTEQKKGEQTKHLS